MVRVGSRYLSSLFVLAVAAALAIPTHAQSDKPDASSQPSSTAPASTATVTSSQAQPADEVDPLKRKQNEKQKKAQKRSLNIELSKTYKKWLNEDVVWIISDEERAAWQRLLNDYPNSVYAAQARGRLEALRRAGAPPGPHHRSDRNAVQRR